MKKLITICAVVTIAMLRLGTISTAQAYEFELGRTTYGDINHGYMSGENGTTEYFTYSQDLSGPPEYEPSAFNFALSTDPHLWDYLYPGPYTAYNTHHLYQSSLNQFTINISMNQANVAAWDRDSSDGPSRNVLGCAWAISSPYYNSPLRGASITDFVLNGSEFSGTLVSDGGIHWAHSPNTANLTLYDYQDTFRFVGSMNDGSLIVYANTVPESATNTTVTALPVANSIGSSDNAPGFAPGSWQASAAVAGQKSEYYVSPQALFGRDVNIGELSSISYFTKKNTTHTINAADWYINIYTKPDTNLPVHGSWYGNRIGSEPYFSQNLLDPCNTWNQWVTGAGQNNRLRFFDSTNNQYFGSYTDGFLSDLTANAAYNNQKILSFSVQTGSGWANGFTGLVDGLSIELTGGDIGQVNFVATSYCPELLAGDLNGDCRVDFEDLKILVDQWLQPPGSPSADIAPSPSGDGRVNFLDFEIMAENWLKCNLQPQSSCP